MSTAEEERLARERMTMDYPVTLTRQPDVMQPPAEPGKEGTPPPVE